MATYDTTTGLRAITGGSLISEIDDGLLLLAQDIANQRHALQPGVIDSGSYMVVQRAAGATMTVDVGANSGRGAYVTDASGRLVFVAPTGSVTNVAVTANASGNPRIDIVTVSTAGVVAVTAGTATVGATLDNRTGAAATPSGALLLADILVANGAVSITNTVIRDRRPWVRGAYTRTLRNTGAAYTGSGTTMAYLDSTNLLPRVECSGVPVVVRLACHVALATATFFFVAPQLDGVGVDGSASVGTSAVGKSFQDYFPITNQLYRVYEWEFTPTAGSHLIGPAVAANGTTWSVYGQAAYPLIWSVRELVCQNTPNNSVTSG